MNPQQEKEFINKCKTNPKLKQQAIETAYLVKALRKIHNPES